MANSAPCRPGRGGPARARRRSGVARPPPEDLGDAQAIGVAGRFALGEQCCDLGDEFRRSDLIGVEVQQPGMAALLLGETLLRSVARPVALDHARAQIGCDGLGAVGRAGIDHDDVIAQAADSGYGASDAVGFVARDDEDRKRGHAGLERERRGHSAKACGGAGRKQPPHGGNATMMEPKPDLGDYVLAVRSRSRCVSIRLAIHTALTMTNRN